MTIWLKIKEQFWERFEQIQERKERGRNWKFDSRGRKLYKEIETNREVEVMEE